MQILNRDIIKECASEQELVSGRFLRTISEGASKPRQPGVLGHPDAGRLTGSSQ
jgi:hypothetical protein